MHNNRSLLKPLVPDSVMVNVSVNAVYQTGRIVYQLLSS